MRAESDGDCCLARASPQDMEKRLAFRFPCWLAPRQLDLPCSFQEKWQTDAFFLIFKHNGFNTNCIMLNNHSDFAKHPWSVLNPWTFGCTGWGHARVKSCLHSLD